MARALMLLSVIFVSVYVTEQAYFLQKDFIDNINEQATTWKVSQYLLCGNRKMLFQIKCLSVIVFKIENRLMGYRLFLQKYIISSKFELQIIKRIFRKFWIEFNFFFFKYRNNNL